MIYQYWLLMIILLTAMFLSVKNNKLTPGGAVSGGVVGCCIYLGASFTGICMIGSFFLLGTFATSWKINIKEKQGDAENNKGRRTAAQVVANGGMAGLLGLLGHIFYDHQAIAQLMMAGALASATADTLSSELGNVYGKKFYNILGFKNGLRGENGVVSMEGTLFGILGSVIIALVYSIGFGWNASFGCIVIGGIIGNTADSVLGATLEKKHCLNNDGVNFINTMAGAVATFLLLKFSNWL